MDSVKNLLTSVMILSFISGFVKILSPYGKNGKLSKQLGLAVALSVLCAIASPLIEAISSVRGSEISFDASYDTVYSPKNAELKVVALAESRLTSELEQIIERKFEINELHISLELDTADISSVELSSAEISGEGELEAAASYLRELLLCPINIKEINR